MLVSRSVGRSLKQNRIAIYLVLILCIFFGWQLSNGPIHGQPLDPPPSGLRPPKEPNPPPRIALVTFITDQKSYIHISLKNRDHYARRHGYDSFVDYESHEERGTMWSKFAMIQRLIKSEKYDWIWWMDFDTLITNTDIKVLDVIEDNLKNATDPDAIDYLLTHDCNGLNAGSFIVRGHERSIRFFDDVRKLHDEKKSVDEQWSEQDCMVDLLKNDEQTRSATLRVPQWQLNAFPKEISCFDPESSEWKPGTFVIHFAGAWAHVEGDDPTGQLMRKYEPQIMWGDWKDFY